MKEPAALLLFVAILSAGAIPMSRAWLKMQRLANPRRSLVSEAALFGTLFALGQIGILGREVWFLETYR
jgi:hypothetical protein